MAREGQKLAAKVKYEGKEFTVKCGWTCVVEAYKETKLKHLETIIDRYRKEDFYSEEVEWKLRNNKIFDRVNYA